MSTPQAELGLQRGETPKDGSTPYVNIPVEKKASAPKIISEEEPQEPITSKVFFRYVLGELQKAGYPKGNCDPLDYFISQMKQSLLDRLYYTTNSPLEKQLPLIVVCAQELYKDKQEYAEFTLDRGDLIVSANYIISGILDLRLPIIFEQNKPYIINHNEEKIPLGTQEDGSEGIIVIGGYGDLLYPDGKICAIKAPKNWREFFYDEIVPTANQKEAPPIPAPKPLPPVTQTEPPQKAKSYTPLEPYVKPEQPASPLPNVDRVPKELWPTITESAENAQRQIKSQREKTKKILSEPITTIKAVEETLGGKRASLFGSLPVSIETTTTTALLTFRYFNPKQYESWQLNPTVAGFSNCFDSGSNASAGQLKVGIRQDNGQVILRTEIYASGRKVHVEEVEVDPNGFISPAVQAVIGLLEQIVPLTQEARIQPEKPRRYVGYIPNEPKGTERRKEKRGYSSGGYGGYIPTMSFLGGPGGGGTKRQTFKSSVERHIAHNAKKRQGEKG